MQPIGQRSITAKIFDYSPGQSRSGKCTTVALQAFVEWNTQLNTHLGIADVAQDPEIVNKLRMELRDFVEHRLVADMAPKVPCRVYGCRGQVVPPLRSLSLLNVVVIASNSTTQRSSFMFVDRLLCSTHNSRDNDRAFVRGRARRRHHRFSSWCAQPKQFIKVIIAMLIELKLWSSCH